MPVIFVLWGLGVLAAIAASLSSGSGVMYRVARNDGTLATANATAEAAINRVALALLESKSERRWRRDGAGRVFVFNGIKMRVSVQDDLGLMDINRASLGSLVSLLKSIGVERRSAMNIAANIQEWRTDGSGAKGRVGRSADKGYHSRHGAFQSVNELLLVRGMTPAIFARIEPSVTIYSGRQFVDPQVAPREVLLAQPNATPEQVDAIMAAREEKQTSTSALTKQGAPSLRGHAFTIRTRFENRSNAFLYQATIRLTGGSDSPFWILNWRGG